MSAMGFVASWWLGCVRAARPRRESREGFDCLAQIRRVLLLAGLIAGALLAGSAPAHATTRAGGSATSGLGPLTLVSRGLPYHHGFCGRRGILNRDAAAEPTVVSDPVHPSRLLAAWFAAPDYDGRDHAGIVDLAARSIDGGRHWRLLPTRGTTKCNGGSAAKDADPAVAWAGDGWSYMLSNPGGPGPGGVPVTRMVLYRFKPGGGTLDPTSVPEPAGYNDRPTITADPSASGRLYVVWVFHDRDRDRVMLATSTDHGRKWAARAIYSAPGGGSGSSAGALWGTQIFRTGRHRLVITYRTLQHDLNWQIDALHSVDDGRRWSSPTRIAHLTPGLPNASGIFSTAAVNDLAAEQHGVVTVIWNDNTPDGHGHVWISRTAAGGGSWTRPHSLVDAPCNVMLPAIAVNHAGVLGATYYAFHQCKPGTAPITDVWFSSSSDRGAHWRTTRLAGPFDFRSTLNLTYPLGTEGEVPGRFLGDYTGLTPTANGFGAIMILPKPYARFGAQDAFFRQVTIR